MRRALVLSGGGARAAFEAGAIEFLVKEAGLDFDMLIGTSAGALNVAVLGSARNYRELLSQTQILKELWLGITGDSSIYRKSWFSLLNLLFKDGLYQPVGLQRLLQEYVDPAVLCANHSKFIKVATVAIETGELFFADSRQKELQDKLLDFILASASLPPFFPPVVIDGKHWYDGGLRDITPLGAAFAERPDEITVILAFPINDKMEPLIQPVAYQGVIHSLVRALNILTTEISANDLHYAQHINAYYRLFPGTRRVPLRIISPSRPLDGDVLDFNPTVIRANLKEGYETAATFFKESLRLPKKML